MTTDTEANLSTNKKKTCMVIKYNVSTNVWLFV